MNEKARRLKEVLEIARAQQALLARGDLKAVQTLQATRQQLLQGIQSLDGEEEEVKAVASEVLMIDQAMGLLLSSEVTDIQRKIQKILSVKKLFHTRRSSRDRRPRHVSRRI